MNGDSPRRWWQWVLMYPAIAIAVFAAVPQFYDWITAIRIGVPFGKVGDAQEQRSAWERNANCVRAVDHITPNSETNYAIDLLTCPSGDILVALTPLQNPTQKVYRWIITKALFTRIAQPSLTTTALAQDTTRTQPAGPRAERVMDTKKQAGAVIARRLQLSDGTCVDETIDAYTGKRLTEKNAACALFDER
jgi:hypothetical protein